MDRVLENLILSALCILIIGLPFSNSIIEITATAAIIMWIMRKVLGKRPLRIHGNPVTVPLLVYFGVCAFSLINSAYLSTSVKGLFFKSLEHVLLFIVITDTVTEARQYKALVGALLFSGALMGIDGLWQYVTGFDFIRGYQIWSMSRIKASFKYPTGFGAWIITVLPLCISLAVSRVKSRTVRLLSGGIAIMLTVCLALNLSRAAWVALLPGLAVLAWLNGERGKKMLLAVLVSLLLAVLVILGVAGVDAISTYTVRASSLVHRAALIEMCIAMWRDYPVLGHGVNTFMSIYAHYGDTSLFDGIAYAHNCYLQIAVETGILGLLAFVWVMVRLVVSSWRDITVRKDGFMKAAGAGLLAGIIAYLCHSALETNLYALQLAILFYFMAGLAVSGQALGER